LCAITLKSYEYLCRDGYPISENLGPKLQGQMTHDQRRIGERVGHSLHAVLASVPDFEKAAYIEVYAKV